MSQIQKIKIVSNNISYGLPPDQEDEVEQRMTINAKGQVWFSSYKYGDGFEAYKLGRKSYRKISKEKAKQILSLIEGFINSDHGELFAADIGDWKMTVTESENKTYEFNGSLCGGVELNGINISNLIRRSIPLQGLFAFDGGENQIDVMLGAIIGLCVGDALGVPVEFQSRESLAIDPVVSMRGYGTYNMPIGTWSDDTSLTLCLLDSLNYGLDYDDIMKKFVSWYKEGSYTQHGEAFDIGITTRESIQRYLSGTDPIKCGGNGERDNGNGSLMRILPIVFYLRSIYGADFFEVEEAVNVIHNISALTHGHIRSQIGCGIYLSVASMLMDETDLKNAVQVGIDRASNFYRNHPFYDVEIESYKRLFDSEFVNLSEDEIRSSGYVVDTLESAIWCLLSSNSYEECVLRAVNLGEDTDTVAAVAGGLAGLYYGIDKIPEDWIDAISGVEVVYALVEGQSIHE